ncbi:hypothetical protein GIB67_010428 [Kingdonia uniflora]|uniref:GPI-anchored protein LLG1-like domain-containing protein n=1 Tax=Kingdonia uniflora TaxID=39325 RepID=A0A7J7MAP3_9MAGN|nr:hypothetical protein GIB67_010428 [Kingdonia uniflora]
MKKKKPPKKNSFSLSLSLSTKMASNRCFILIIFFFFFFGSTSSTFISDNVFESHVGSNVGRNLLQAKKGCKLDGAFGASVEMDSEEGVEVDGEFVSLDNEPGNNEFCKVGCSVNLEFQNYTIITSQCKGPRYPPKLCCAALKEFACPFAGDLNDATNDCASTMFSYINLYGKYPPGLFASECREGKEGLDCGVAPSGSSADMSRGLITHALSPYLLLTCVLVILSQIF